VEKVIVKLELFVLTGKKGIVEFYKERVLAIIKDKDVST